jgi:hypothetical protein
MHGEDGDDEENGHGDGGERHERSEEEARPPKSSVRIETQAMRCGGCAEGLKDSGEVVGAAAEFREAVLHESESDDEA